jgi:hypothetical protein
MSSCRAQHALQLCANTEQSASQVRVVYAPRRSANCAGRVIASASSRMTSLRPDENSFRDDAKSLICSRTMSIPRSSEAFSCERVESRRVESR